MLLQKRPEMWADPAFARQHLSEVWSHYDRDSDGQLSRSELAQLAKDLVARVVSMCKDGLRAQLPNSSDAELDKIVRKELKHILPAPTLDESCKLMAEHLRKELDLDKNGVITRTEFQFAWVKVAQQVLEVNQQKQAALTCAIL